MNANVLLISIALGTGWLAGCDRNQPVVGAPPQPSSTTPPTTPAALPTPTMSQKPATASELKAGAAPIQGQVDPKEPAQRRAFEDTKR